MHYGIIVSIMESYFGGKQMLYDADRKADEELAIHNAIMVAESRKVELIDAILDPLALKAIAMTIGRSLSVKDLSVHLGISNVKTYDIVGNLTDLGLMARTPKLRTSTHGRAIGYTATVKSGYIDLRDGRLEIHCISKEGRECFAEDALNQSCRDSSIPMSIHHTCSWKVPTRRL